MGLVIPAKAGIHVFGGVDACPTPSRGQALRRVCPHEGGGRTP
jgi:hypothetical protein